MLPAVHADSSRFNLTSAMRVLFTVAIVLVSLSRRDVRETGAESVLSALMAGAVAVAFSVLYTFWPQPGAALLAMAFLGLLVVPRAFSGRHQGAVVAGDPSGLGAARDRGGQHARRRRSTGASTRSWACSMRSGRAR